MHVSQHLSRGKVMQGVVADDIKDWEVDYFRGESEGTDWNLSVEEHLTGPRSICLRDSDAFVILMLYRQEPSTALWGYVNDMYSHIGRLDPGLS